MKKQPLLTNLVTMRRVAISASYRVWGQADSTLKILCIKPDAAGIILKPVEAYYRPAYGINKTADCLLLSIININRSAQSLYGLLETPV